VRVRSVRGGLAMSGRGMRAPLVLLVLLGLLAAGCGGARPAGAPSAPAGAGVGVQRTTVTVAAPAGAK